MSSTIRTPWPNRSAPQKAMASWIDGNPESLTRVDREVSVRITHVLERVEVPARWVSGLGAGDVEPDHSAVPESHREFGDLPRPGGMPHRRQETADADLPSRDPGSGFAGPETFENVLDDLVQTQALFQVLLGRKTDLGIDDVVVGQILGTLTCHPCKPFGGVCITATVCANVSR